MRSQPVDEETMKVIDRLLLEPNRLILRLSYATGLRISDILSIEQKNFKQDMTVKEQKTGKSKRIHIPIKLFREIERYRFSSVGGKKYLFPHRLDENKHRTRQVVWWDIKRAGKAIRCRENITPHSLRKMYAVSLLNKGYGLTEIQEKLNHSNTACTMYYVFSELLNRKKIKNIKKVHKKNTKV